ncbi:acyl-CoA dehydrogenase family protein [Peribacillus frigoritolerans]|uniref:acyl-CoA dehydrogenase family protein n=1 Tax=Peribacillus frigoritolerans TaxID=450367 RepID=UPI003F7E2BEC
MNETIEMNDLVSLVKSFVSKEIVDQAVIHDRDNSYPYGIVEKLKELGFFGLTISEEYGGLGIPKLTYLEIIEELAKGWASVPGLLNSHLIVASLIEKFGTESQKENYLEKLANGEVRGAILLTEPNAGSDLKAIKTKVAIKDNIGTISGQKTMITNGRESQLYAVLSHSPKGLSIYLIPSNRSGITVGKDLEKLGFKGLETVEIYLENVEIQSTDLLGIEGKGLSHFMNTLEFGRLSIAASSIGVAQAAFEHALNYSKQREAFGKPICEMQVVQVHLAEMYTQISAARALMRDAAQITIDKKTDIQTSAAKFFASETATNVAITALRVFGGYGYFKEYPIERYIRDATMYLVGEGSNDTLKISIAKKLIQRF